MKNKSNIKLLDCTIRDGGYVNGWDFDIKVVRETYRALSKAGVDFVELGYHGTEKYFDRTEYGIFRFSAADDINKVCHSISGAKVALMVDYGKFDLDDLKQYRHTPVKLIRMAFHKKDVRDALSKISRIKDMGFETSANFMGFTSYSKPDIDRILKILKDTPPDYAYVVDSYGSMFPNQAADFYGPLLKLKNIEWGFHSHNNLQMAFANTLRAMDAGVRIIDSSVYGMGRGAGNLPTEIMVAYLQLAKPEKYNPIPVLNLIDHYFAKLHQSSPWGYGLAYMLSGIYNCHPSYVKDLVERKEYDVEDMWKILNIIGSSAPEGFNKGLLDGILKDGFFNKKMTVSGSRSKAAKGAKVKADVKYIDRHKDADFLILANGQSLKDNAGRISAFIEEHKPIVMAANYLGSLFVPHYHAFSNKRRFIDYIDTVDKRSKLLIGQHIPEQMVRDYTDRRYETIYYDNIDGKFSIHDGIVGSHCRTVALLLMGVAIVMGARRIFVAGLDGYMGLGDKGRIHFYPEQDEAETREALLVKHRDNLRYLEQIDRYLGSSGREGLHIITPTNYTKFYKGIENYITV